MGRVDLERDAELGQHKSDNFQHSKFCFKRLLTNSLRLTLITCLVVLNLRWAHAAEVSFAWNETEGATGYKIYYGYESRMYSFEVDIGLWTQCTISGLENGRIYYFAVTAYNESEESEFSDELTCCSAACDADIHSDGDIDGSDLQSFIVGSPPISLFDFASAFGTENCAD